MGEICQLGRDAWRGPWHCLCTRLVPRSAPWATTTIRHARRTRGRGACKADTFAQRGGVPRAAQAWIGMVGKRCDVVGAARVAAAGLGRVRGGSWQIQRAVLGG